MKLDKLREQNVDISSLLEVTIFSFFFLRSSRILVRSNWSVYQTFLAFKIHYNAMLFNKGFLNVILTLPHSLREMIQIHFHSSDKWKTTWHMKCPFKQNTDSKKLESVNNCPEWKKTFSFCFRCFSHFLQSWVRRRSGDPATSRITTTTLAMTTRKRRRTSAWSMSQTNAATVMVQKTKCFAESVLWSLLAII